MAYSYVTRSGNGSNKTFTFSFEGPDEGYIRDEDLEVFVEGQSVPFTLTSSNTVELLSIPPSGEDNVIIKRSMPRDMPYADFKRGNNFGQEVLNNSFLQLLYLVQELMDGFYPEGSKIREDIEYLKNATIHGDLTVLGKTRILSSDPNDDKSAVNFEEGDARYKDPFEADVDELNTKVSGIESDYKRADANLQSQITGDSPLEASAFSPVSWHDQSIDNSLEVPADKNAWSFGPVMTISPGQSVTVGEGSYWTIAEGFGDSSDPLAIDEGEL